MDQGVAEFHYGRTFIAPQGDLHDEFDDSVALDRRTRDRVSLCVCADAKCARHQAPAMAARFDAMRKATLFEPQVMRQSPPHRDRRVGPRWRERRIATCCVWPISSRSLPDSAFLSEHRSRLNQKPSRRMATDKVSSAYSIGPPCTASMRFAIGPGVMDSVSAASIVAASWLRTTQEDAPPHGGTALHTSLAPPAGGTGCRSTARSHPALRRPSEHSIRYPAANVPPPSCGCVDVDDSRTFAGKHASPLRSACRCTSSNGVWVEFLIQIHQLQNRLPGNLY